MRQINFFTDYLNFSINEFNSSTIAINCFELSLITLKEDSCSATEAETSSAAASGYWDIAEIFSMDFNALSL